VTSSTIFVLRRSRDYSKTAAPTIIVIGRVVWKARVIADGDGETDATDGHQICFP